ncbi:MAG: M20/M25/M40 family metallo-hydrolase [Spirochaetota bacterium]
MRLESTGNERLKAILKSLVRIRSDSGSDMSEIIRAAQAFLKQEGIDTRIYWDDSKTPCLVARYKRRNGKDGIGESLGLHCHLDTAEAGSEGWRVDPLSAQEIKGRIFGRGTLDCKGLAAVWIDLFLDFSSAADDLPFDLLLVMSTDEETGGESIKRLLSETQEAHGCFLILGEGGGFPILSGKATFYTVQTGEMERTSIKGTSGLNSTNLSIQEIVMGIRRRMITRETLLFWIRRAMGLKDASRSLVASPLRAEMRGSDGVYLSPLSRKASPTRQNNGSTRGKALTLGLNAMRKALRLVDKNFRILPLVTPGTSDNRHYRNYGLPVLGFFPLCRSNSISGYHGANEYILTESLDLAKDILRNTVIAIKEAIDG